MGQLQGACVVRRANARRTGVRGGAPGGCPRGGSVTMQCCRGPRGRVGCRYVQAVEGAMGGHNVRGEHARGHYAYYKHGGV